MKRNIQIGIMIVAVLFAVCYNQYQLRHHNEEIAVSYFITNHIKSNMYMDGIDFSKPVKVFHIKKGDVFIQYQIPSAPQGNFYGLEGASPSELGINEFGYDKMHNIPVKKLKRVYVATKDFDALSSYAAPIKDDWSTPEDETQTEGSAIQLFSTCKPCFEEQ